MSRIVTGQTLVAGVAGAPVSHSLSPILHNAWIAATDLDAVYVAFPTPEEGFADFVRSLRGGVVRGLNVTAPFKESALGLADKVSSRARRAGAANLLIFEPQGMILADNTDGLGLLDAFAVQAPQFSTAAGPVVVLGAGGAGRGAVAALLDAGAPEVRLVNRSRDRAETVAQAFDSRVIVYALRDWDLALEGAAAAINATPVGFGDTPMNFDAAPDDMVAMDMVYWPLQTPFLAAAAARGLARVDGLAMLIGQARPSFTALFGQEPSDDADVRAIALSVLEHTP